MRLLHHIYRRFHQQFPLYYWVTQGFQVPCPNPVKWKLLLRHGGRGIWIETGTYLGDTTLFLDGKSKKVITIEPSLELFNSAKERFKGYKNIEIVNSDSENCLGGIVSNLGNLSGEEISFWLDGHFSEGLTFQGIQDTPVIFELNTISQLFDTPNNIVIFVDDVRCFNPKNKEYETYPSLVLLLEWCQSQNLMWLIENDILIMKKSFVQEISP